MANSLITNQIIAKEAVRLYRNKNAMLRNVDRQYDDSFARTGAKVGQSIRVRLPVDYNLRTGPTAIIQNTVETNLTLTVAGQYGVDMSFSLVDRTMTIDRFSERYIKPAINKVVGGIAVNLMQGAEGGSSNWVANQDANGNILTPTIGEWLNAKASLLDNSSPSDDYKIVLSPRSEANAVKTLAGYFNSQPTIAKQYDNGEMRHALGSDWMADQTVLLHTTGMYATSTPAYTPGAGFAATTVSGANQTGASLIVAALAGPLNKGDFIRIQGVQGVNRVTEQPTGTFRDFTLTASVPAGATVLPIYPPILGVDGLGNPQQYQTVNASPANAAQVYVTAAPGAQYRKNLCFVPEAITLACVDMEMPPNIDGARETFDDVSVRIVTQYAVMSDQNVTRLDILTGNLWIKPEWCTTVPDIA